jgi:superfamily II DNA/RNA helicase
MNEASIEATTYHGDLNSREREANLQTFREGKHQFMVCTDIAARGLDIPDIDHVIMFDFPLNPIDYIHRGGRCGRAGRKGLVTSLVAKRDKVLSDAIQGAIARGLPIDSLTASKKDYQDRGKLAKVVGRMSKEDAPKKKKVFPFAPKTPLAPKWSDEPKGRSQRGAPPPSPSKSGPTSGVGYKKGSANRGTVVKGLGSR